MSFLYQGGRFAAKTASRGFYSAACRRYFCAAQQPPKYNFFDFGSKIIPHPDKVKKGGEDAMFANKNVLCVADGVGGWAEVGVDPALYSKALCRNVDDLVKKRWDIYKISPRQLIIDAADKTKEEGSSTVCVAVLDEERPLLHTAFIGDSSYMLLRRVNNAVKVIVRSQEQQKEFNFPYQIGSHGDPPQVAVVTQHKVEHNDVVVLGTDGVFDNLDDQQIVNTVRPFIDASLEIADIPLIAEMIAELAYKCSLDPNYFSPFGKKAREAFYDFRGGKSDDITVVVGQVKLVSTSSPKSPVQESDDEEKAERR